MFTAWRLELTINKNINKAINYMYRFIFTLGLRLNSEHVGAGWMNRI